jgi:hypothetical protein
MLMLAPALLLALSAVPASSGACDAVTLSARIDQWIETRLAREGVSPAPLADDAEFFRRLSLDLNGRIPSALQLADFLDDSRPDKRRLWTDELLDGRDNAPLYANHFTNVWRRRLLSLVAPQPRDVVGPLEAWLQRQLEADTPYDRLVRGLLTDSGAAGFRKAYEDKPENLAGVTARLFLGVRLECAQCHNHPFASWSRKQFWQFAAFFATPQIGQKPRIRIGGIGAWAEARFLDGSQPDWTSRSPSRAALAEWVAQADNRWFARAAVNRIWHDLFGVGLIDPVDGLGTGDNLPSHPELLDELARQFVLHKFDTKYLLRAIVGSRAYQRSSRQTGAGSRDDVRLFARASVRALSGEQLRDSILAVTGYMEGNHGRNSLSANVLQAEFVALFEDASAGPLDSPSSIQQSLAMMNSRFIAEVTNPTNSPALAAVLDGRSSRPAARRIADLYFLVLSRRPRPDELGRLHRYIQEGAVEPALRDVLWALLNSTEFLVNH